ncbi:MAG: Asp23/Gls24 family envelope stress response protein [Clostridiales bacterium]|nr:Asp23/Gls24 family envelope stress response protein [Clostridiales bacterium]
MSNDNDEKSGIVKIADEVIAICAVNATLRTPGVAEFSPVFSDNFSKSFFGKDPLYKGLKISQHDDGITVDIYIVVDYGVKIPAVAWDIQENVKNEIEEMTDALVKAVNIHVQGVRMKGEGGSADEQV